MIEFLPCKQWDDDCRWAGVGCTYTQDTVKLIVSMTTYTVKLRLTTRTDILAILHSKKNCPNYIKYDKKFIADAQSHLCWCFTKCLTQKIKILILQHESVSRQQDFDRLKNLLFWTCVNNVFLSLGHGFTLAIFAWYYIHKKYNLKT